MPANVTPPAPTAAAVLARVGDGVGDRVGDGVGDEEYELIVRIGWSWKELRRGAAMGALRAYMFGDGQDTLLEPGQWDTLDLLVRQPTWRMSELADGLRVDPSTATRAVQRLLKTGLAERHSCVDDGRVVLVSATEQARSLHEAIVGHRMEIMRAVVGSFDLDERRQFAEYLERMVGSIDQFVSALHDRA